jgi:hypothetical protein
MITAGIEGMMIPKPTLSMNTDSKTKVSAARDEVKRWDPVGRKGRALSGICPMPC